MVVFCFNFKFMCNGFKVDASCRGQKMGKNCFLHVSQGFPDKPCSVPPTLLQTRELMNLHSTYETVCGSGWEYGQKNGVRSVQRVLGAWAWDERQTVGLSLDTWGSECFHCFILLLNVCFGQLEGESRKSEAHALIGTIDVQYCWAAQDGSHQLHVTPKVLTS